MARRNVLNGATDWEREAKANQQRDYAAQLQEQVRLKQAKQEQEKQRKLQEQREELEMLVGKSSSQFHCLIFNVLIAAKRSGRRLRRVENLRRNSKSRS
ncbi:hypothetical protein PHYBOEH_010906 [Phytophthora boehmeriae]|uniref:Uncharacterized protein n=1 Tax=Phytophthora boehmeriae TaxID=109152 RepID=A0A8T1WWN7_9STRA|nr:hypothetical protein PHYBOEH_010906 [Phytophthora boehmeriae]